MSAKEKKAEEKETETMIEEEVASDVDEGEEWKFGEGVEKNGKSETPVFPIR